MKCDSYYIFFDTISNKTRMNIIDSLMKKPKSVNEICADIKEEQSKVSHSLKRLMDCNFLNVQREGKKKIYALNEETIIPIFQLVDKHVSKFCTKECMRRAKG
jgi:DNA-binding transcriptional ArsR family regulator